MQNKLGWIRAIADKEYEIQQIYLLNKSKKKDCYTLSSLPPLHWFSFPYRHCMIPCKESRNIVNVNLRRLRFLFVGGEEQSVMVFTCVVRTIKLDINFNRPSCIVTPGLVYTPACQMGCL